MNTNLFCEFRNLKKMFESLFKCESIVKTNYNLCFVVRDYLDSISEYGSYEDSNNRFFLFLGYKTVYINSLNDIVFFEDLRKIIKSNKKNFYYDFIWYWLNTRTNWYDVIKDYTKQREFVENLLTRA